MKKILLPLLAILAGSMAHASGSAVDALAEKLAPLKHLQGSFTQRQYDLDDQLLAESSGQFRLLRPGYFAWEIQSPDSQLIIADPDFLWHYDRDIETATRRPVSIDGQWTPFQILGGDTAALVERFDVEQLDDGTFRLEPLQTDAGFRELTLTLQGAQLTRMQIRDNLDQRVDISFTGLDSDTPIKASDFAFSPPPGADTFYYDE